MYKFRKDIITSFFEVLIVSSDTHTQNSLLTVHPQMKKRKAAASRRFLCGISRPGCNPWLWTVLRQLRDSTFSRQHGDQGDLRALLSGGCGQPPGSSPCYQRSSEVGLFPQSLLTFWAASSPNPRQLEGLGFGLRDLMAQKHAKRMKDTKMKNSHCECLSLLVCTFNRKE